MLNRYFISAIIVVAVLPLAICATFWALPIGSTGPMVPAIGIVNVLVLPVLFFKGCEKAFKSDNWKPALVILAILLGVIFAVAGMKYFMVLTYIFGIMDYQVM